MASQAAPRVAFNVAQMTLDMAAKGWIGKDLARKAKVSEMAVSRFLRGQTQSPRVAKKLAQALGKPLETYIALVEQEASA
jgi:transcriptional regulator with XRE-family HTH domain